jgi:arginyl-tRNA synthetase
MAVPLAFELARRLRKAPRAIAQEIAGALGPIPGVSRAEAAPNGYINVFLDRAALVRQALSGTDAVTPATAGASAESAAAIPRVKTIVEHTAINPNKAAHVGHLRNATMGDTMVRLLRFCGVPVEVQNYIDDTGVQVADVVVGFRELEGKSLDEIRHIAETTRFDYYCWDLYARVGDWYAADKAHLAARSAALQAIEHGGNETAEIGAFIADRIVRAHLQTMGRLNVDYDLLTWEGDILRLKFWATAFEILKQSGAMFKQDQGKLAGCWVMVIDEDAGLGDADQKAAEAAEAADDSDDEEERREKVIVRSDGTVTYVGKDIALQFWKFGLLGKDFHYRRFSPGLDGKPVWATTTNPTSDEATTPPAFGHASVTYNIIDTRQSYLQKLLKQALATLGHVKEAERAIHFAYEMVGLTHRTARELGYTEIDES